MAYMDLTTVESGRGALGAIKSRTTLAYHARLSSITRAPCRKVMGGARPALAGGAVGGECNLIVLDPGDVLDDAFAVRGPSIDAEGEVSSQSGHLRPPIPPLIHCAAAVYYHRRRTGLSPDMLV